MKTILNKLINHDILSKEDAKQLLDFALEGRRRVKNQLIIMDETFNEVDFSYSSGVERYVAAQKPVDFNSYSLGVMPWHGTH